MISDKIIDPMQPAKGKFDFFTKDPMSWTIIVVIVSFFTIFLVLPLAFSVVAAFFSNGELKLNTYATIFGNKRYWDPLSSEQRSWITIDKPLDTGVTTVVVRGPNFGIILNTIILGIGTTIVSLVLGLTAALIMARVEIPFKTLISGLLLVPLILPPFVGGIGYRAMMGSAGILNQYILKPNFNMVVEIKGIFALVFVQSMHYFTLIYLNVYSSLMNSDPSLEESAENLGASRWTIMRTVTLPLAMPGIASGSILVLILAMEDLGTPIIFGNTDQFARNTITYSIFETLHQNSTQRNIDQALAIMGLILLIFALIGFYAIRKYVSLKQYSMVSKGRAGKFRTFEPNILGKVLFLLFYAVLFIVSTLPHIGVVLIASTKPQVFPFEFTWENYSKIFDVENGFGVFTRNTLVFSFTATFIIAILASFAGYVANRKDFRGQSIFDTLVTIPIAIPGVVLGLGYLKMFGGFPDWGIFTLNPLIFPPFLLILSYTIRKFPFTVRSVYAGLQQTDEVLEESAINMGASKPRVLFDIVFRLIALNIIGGALVSLVYNMSEVSTTLILISSPDYGTLTWKMADESGKLGELAAIGVFLMILQIISLLVTNVLLKNRADAISGI